MTNVRSTIAVLVDEYVDYQKVLIDSIVAENQSRGYGTLCITGRELDRRKANVQHSLGGRLYPVLQSNILSGLISLTGTIGNNVEAAQLAEFVYRFRVPKVSVGIEIPGMPNVLVNDQAGMGDLVCHLIEDTKARNIAFVQGFHNDPYSDHREQIYRAVLGKAGIEVDESLIVRGNYDPFETYQVVQDLLRRQGDNIDAIVAANDAMALSTARAITSLGYDIPGDIAVTGFDDTGEASRHSPALTTVRQPLVAIARQSVQLLQEQIDYQSDNQPGSITAVVESELVVRGSTLLAAKSQLGLAAINSSAERLYEQILVSMSGLSTPENIDLSRLTDCLWATLADGGNHLALALDKSLIHDIGVEQQNWWSNLCHQMESCSERILASSPEKPFLPVVIAALSAVKERIWALSMEQEFDIARVRNAHAIMHLRMSSCTKRADILATLTEWLECIKPRRWYLVWYDKPRRTPDRQAKLVQVSSLGSPIKFDKRKFESAEILPPSLADEFNNGLLVLSPIYAGGVHFGYLLIDPVGIKSIDVASVSISIGNAMRNRYLMRKLKQKSSDLGQANIELNQLAKFDALTGLPNRWHFHQMLQEAYAKSSDEETTLGVLFVDLDGFKIVNDTMGHDAGDNLLKIISGRLQQALVGFEGDGYVARLGGDEFTAIVQVHRLYGGRQLAELSAVMLKLVTQPCDIEGQSVVVSASIGYSMNTSTVHNAESLLNQADVAMYRAKANGRNVAIPYTSDLESADRRRMHLEQNLRKALVNGDLQVHFQPRIDLESGRICGAEALMRWIEQSDEGPVVVARPDEFIPVAEKTGLIKELDALALEQCLIQLKEWEKSGIDITVSINVSVACLQQESFVDDVLGRIKYHVVQPSSVELEITESAAMADVEDSFAKLDSFKKAGVRLSIDDFGTGYSSLSYLKKFPVDHLKIDRSFIMEITEENFENLTETAVVRSIVALGKSLQIGLVAEGVEDELQLNFVKSLGCEEGQGYYFYKPMPASELTAVLVQESGQLSQRAA